MAVQLFAYRRNADESAVALTDSEIEKIVMDSLALYQQAHPIYTSVGLCLQTNGVRPNTGCRVLRILRDQSVRRTYG